MWGVGRVGWVDKEAPVFEECGYIIKEAVFMYWQNLWLNLKMEPIMIFMMPPQVLSLKGKICFGPQNYNSMSNLVIHQYGS